MQLAGIAVVALASACDAASLTLHGTESRITMGDATLHATCGAGQSPFVKYVSPQRASWPLHELNGQQFVRAWLSGVATTCASTHTLDEPCASAEEDDLDYPFLFECHWLAELGSLVSAPKPVPAGYKTVFARGSGSLLGIAPYVNCSVPMQAEVAQLSGFAASGVELILEVHHRVNVSQATGPGRYIVDGRNDNTSPGCSETYGKSWGVDGSLTSDAVKSVCVPGSDIARATAGIRCCTNGGGRLGDAHCPSGECQPHSLTDAETHCSNLGGRLCSQSEVLAGVVYGTGCSYDTMHIWTDTEC